MAKKIQEESNVDRAINGVTVQPLSVFSEDQIDEIY